VGFRHGDTWRLQETYRAPLKVGEWRVAWTNPAQPDTGFSYFWVVFLMNHEEFPLFFCFLGEDELLEAPNSNIKISKKIMNGEHHS